MRARRVGSVEKRTGSTDDLLFLNRKIVAVLRRRRGGRASGCDILRQLVWKQCKKAKLTPSGRDFYNLFNEYG
jgi:hypothetical protein